MTRPRTGRRQVRPPAPHPSGATPPPIPRELGPRHVAIVMDGNGRWAKQRGLPRTAGHEQGEHSLFDVVEGAIEIGVKAVSAYAFSTEYRTRSPDEVRFLWGFIRYVLSRLKWTSGEIDAGARCLRYDGLGAVAARLPFRCDPGDAAGACLLTD